MTSAKRFTEIERVDRHIPLILKLDLAGTPRKWIHWQDATILAWNDKVKWSLGEPIMLIGGTNRAGEKSTFALPPIIASDDVMEHPKDPPLTNRELFRRDRFICLYCGTKYPTTKLTRDHVRPVSRKGINRWSNCVTACRSCNHRKADRTPEEAGMSLLAVPYAPSPAAYLMLQNSGRIIADQMSYLEKMMTGYERKHLLN